MKLLHRLLPTFETDDPGAMADSADDHIERVRKPPTAASGVQHTVQSFHAVSTNNTQSVPAMSRLVDSLHLVVFTLIIAHLVSEEATGEDQNLATFDQWSHMTSFHARRTPRDRQAQDAAFRSLHPQAEAGSGGRLVNAYAAIGNAFIKPLTIQSVLGVQ